MWRMRTRVLPHALAGISIKLHLAMAARVDLSHEGIALVNDTFRTSYCVYVVVDGYTCLGLSLVQTLWVALRI